jgi:nitroreductase
VSPRGSGRGKYLARQGEMTETAAAPMSVLEAIARRRSVRAYAPHVIDERTVRSLLGAAVQAPTAMHAEPWAFVIIQDAQLLKRYSDRAKSTLLEHAATFHDLHRISAPPRDSAFARALVNPDFNIFYNAGTLIVLCGQSAEPFVPADCWLAAENLMLAAAAMGLGTCCIGSALPALNLPESRAELDIPADVSAFAAVIVGVPAETPQAVPRKEPRILTWKRGVAI